MDKEVLISALEQIGFKVEVLSNKIIAKKDGNSVTIYNDYEVWHIFKELMKCAETLKMWEIHRVLQIVH